ncbi:MAG: B12-binding domain-containing radical SAM protein [Candidatus Hermodarchaeota archaeon]
MKILLIRHHNIGNINTRLPNSINKAQGIYPPLGIAYIASYLKKYNYDVSILDSKVLNLTTAETKDRILKEKPDIVGITSMTPIIKGALEAAKLVKEVSNNIITVIGGPHISVFPKETLSYDFIDFGIYGEGEHTMLELVNSIHNGKDFSNITGLVYKRNKKVYINQPALVENLDELPFPSRDLLPVEKYHCVISKKPFTTMMTSRGCPFKCSFCFKGPSDKKIRYRSANDVVNEIEHCIEKYKVKTIMFYDDTFNLNKNHVKNICNIMIERGIDVEWEAPARVDLVNEKILRLMKRAGCVRLRYGVESGNDEILALMNKRITVRKVEEVFRTTKKNGIKTFAYFMIGYITEDEKTIRNTINFAKKIDPDWIMFNVVTPLPLTDLHELCVEKGKIGQNYWKDFVLNKTNERLPFLVENADKWVRRAYREFYFRPKVLLKKLFAIRSIDTIKKYITGFRGIVFFEMKSTNV